MSSSPQLKYDLHTHTNASDGSLSIQELAQEAAQKGLDAIGICDHDTLDTVHAVHKLAPNPREFTVINGVKVFGGVEISAVDLPTKRKVHIAVYGLPRSLADEDSEIFHLTQTIRDQRRNNILAQQKLVKEAGYSFNDEKFEHASKDGATLYKQHLMKAMTDEPYTSDAYQDLYEECFSPRGKFYKPVIYVDAFKAVKAAVSDGGVPILVHPGEVGVFDLVEDLVAAGLKGVEVYHPSHNQDDVEQAIQLSQRFNLFQTGGSDYHAAYGKTTLGECLTPPEWAVQLDEILR